MEEVDRVRKNVILSSKRKAKGEAFERDNLFPCVKKNNSGLGIDLWIKFLIEDHELASSAGGISISYW